MNKRTKKYLKSKEYKKWKADVKALQKSLQPKVYPWYVRFGAFVLAWALWALMWLGFFYMLGQVLPRP